MKPRALVLTGYGINTDLEMAHAFELAGAEAERLRAHLMDELLAFIEARQDALGTPTDLWRTSRGSATPQAGSSG